MLHFRPFLRRILMAHGACAGGLILTLGLCLCGVTQEQDGSIARAAPTSYKLPASDEALEIATSESDAIVICQIESVRDTIITTRILDNGHKAGRYETWVTSRILSQTKGPTNLSANQRIQALVWPTSPELDNLRAAGRGSRRSALLLLKRHQRPEDRAQDPIASDIAWILVGPSGEYGSGVIWADEPEAEKKIQLVTTYVSEQTPSSLAKRADLVVYAKAKPDATPCGLDGASACVPLAISGVLAGNVRQPTITIMTRGVDLPLERSVYFLRSRPDGVYELVGRRAGAITMDAAEHTGEAAWLAKVRTTVLEARRHAR